MKEIPDILKQHHVWEHVNRRCAVPFKNDGNKPVTEFKGKKIEKIKDAVFKSVDFAFRCFPLVSGYELRNIQFENVDFSGSTFKFTVFDGSSFKNCSFLNTEMYRVSFEGCKFDGVLFTGSILEEVNFTKVESKKLWLDYCEITNCTFDYAKTLTTYLHHSIIDGGWGRLSNHRHLLVDNSVHYCIKEVIKKEYPVYKYYRNRFQEMTVEDIEQARERLINKRKKR